MLSLTRLPEPPTRPGSGHLQDWALRPLPLIEAGAAAARAAGTGAFRLRLGLPAVVGLTPAWNRRLLTDLRHFASAGSFSQLVPYLAGGVILTDAPGHAGRRRLLNLPFGKAETQALRERMRAAQPPLPGGTFDALAWADGAVRRQLNAAYFSGEFDDELLHAFLAPLRRPFPAPALPRPRLLWRVEAELRRLAARRLPHTWAHTQAHTQAGRAPDLLSALMALPGGLTETRISLAAAHDTTTHALAYALWHLAGAPEWHRPERHPAVLKEVLRLYPPGWMGSRRLTRPLVWEGVTLPRGALALYSPYLLGRDPALWERPLAFEPGRWDRPPPAWGYLPFGGGERLCLGVHLSQALILDVLAGLPGLTPLGGDAEPHPGITLGPRGPLWLRAAQDS